MKPNKVKALRYQLGLSQKDVADELGITAQQYYRKENGKNKFDDVEKSKLRAILKLNIDDWNNLFYDGILPLHEE